MNLLKSFIIFLVLMTCSSGYAAISTQKEISLLLNKIKKDAEQQIINIHGKSTLVGLKNSLIREYNLNETPLPKKGDPCPALGFTEDDIGTVIRAKALNRAGVYYVIATEAVLKSHPEIAKWGFANASSLSLDCASYISNLAFILNEYKDFKHAIILLEYAKQLDPTESSIYVNLAFSYQNLHRYNDAINEMMIAIAFHPKLKEYQEMLAKLKSLKKEEKKYRFVTKDKTRPHQVPQLDEALDMLEEKKERELQKDMEAALNFPLPYNNRTRKQKRTRRRRSEWNLVNSYDISAFEEKDSTLCGYFSQRSHLLIRMGDGMVEKSGYAAPGGNPIEKFIGVGAESIQLFKKNNKSLKDVAALGAFATASLFYGIAGEMYELCGEVGEWPEIDKLIDDIIYERMKQEKEFFENIDKEKFSKPVCTYKICVSRGDRKSLQISISDPWLDVEIKLHPTNIYACELKLSKGGDIFKKDIGSLVSGGTSYSHYFKWKFGRGVSGGTEIVTGVNVGKYVTTKFEKPTSIVDYSFENATGTTK